MAFWVRHGQAGTWKPWVGLKTSSIVRACRYISLAIFFCLYSIWSYMSIVVICKNKHLNINAMCHHVHIHEFSVYLNESTEFNRSVQERFRGTWMNFKVQARLHKLGCLSDGASFNEKTQNHPGWWILLTLVLDATEAKPGFTQEGLSGRVGWMGKISVETPEFMRFVCQETHIRHHAVLRKPWTYP